MNWNQAVEAMRAGHCVRRKSQSYRRVIDEGNPDFDGAAGAAIVEEGQEGCRLMHAWTADEKPVAVFMGRYSHCLFVPDDEDRGATDWVIEE